MDKTTFRKQMKKQLAAIGRLEYEQYSYEIARRLYDHPYWKEAETLGITVSNIPEVDTWQIIRRAWQEGKKVAVPKCLPKSRDMDFREITSFKQLEQVYSGLYEPKPGDTPYIQKGQIELLLVPGLAFTKDGYRLGFGGGYYDRYLQGYTGQKISLAFSIQLCEQLPIQDHDLPVDHIITERESFICGHK